MTISKLFFMAASLLIGNSYGMQSVITKMRLTKISASSALKNPLRRYSVAYANKPATTELKTQLNALLSQKHSNEQKIGSYQMIGQINMDEGRALILQGICVGSWDNNAAFALIQAGKNKQKHGAALHSQAQQLAQLNNKINERIKQIEAQVAQ